MTLEDKQTLAIVQQRIDELRLGRISGSIEIHMADGKPRLVRTIRNDRVQIINDSVKPSCNPVKRGV